MNKDVYQSPNISGFETELEKLVSDWHNLLPEDEKGMNHLNISHVHSCIDYIMNHLPEGLERVDGSTVQDMLAKV